MSARSNLEMDYVRILLVESYRQKELYSKIKRDFPELHEKWNYYRSIGSNFCPRVMGVFHSIVKLILEDKALHDKYAVYFKSYNNSSNSIKD